MKQLPLFSLVALLGAAVSAPAQVSIEARIGRHVAGSVVVGSRDHRHDRPSRESRHFPAPPVGRWETVREQFLVPGYWQEERLPPTYGWIQDSCGRAHWGIVDRGGLRRTWVPARWETRSRQVWVSC